MDEDIDHIVATSLPPAEILETPMSVSLDRWKMYMMDLTIDYSRDGTEQPAVNALAVQVFSCGAEIYGPLHLERASPTRWKYDGNISFPDSDGLTLVAQSEDIGNIGHMHLTRSEVEDFLTCALSNAKFEFVRRLTTEEHAAILTLSFMMCIIPVGDNFDQSIAWARAAMEDPELLFPLASQIPDHHPAKTYVLNDCGTCFLKRFHTTRDEHDINNSIIAFEQAAQFSSLEYLHNAGNAFEERYYLKRNLSDLNRAIEILEAGLTLDGDANLPSLMDHFKRTGNVSNMSGRMPAHQKIIHLAPESYANMSILLFNLGDLYLRRFDYAGDLSDISDATLTLQKSIHLMHGARPERPGRLDILGFAFSHLFERTGDINDISEAVLAHQKAIDLTPEGHPGMPERLSNLGISLSRRFKRTSNLNDISKAISAQRKAVFLLPEGHTSKPTSLQALAISLIHSFEQTGNLSEISEAISALQRVVLLTTPEERLAMPFRLKNLASSFDHRCMRTRDLNDNFEAISAAKEAIRLTPEDDAHMSMLLNNLGKSFSLRFRLTGDRSEAATAISKFRLAATSSTGLPLDRLEAALLWADLSELIDPPQALDAWSAGIELLSQVIGMEQTIQRRHENLVKFSDLSTSAAATAFSLGHPEMALKWLEQGRCLVWNQLNNLRTPLDELYASDPTLADHFSRVSRALENAGSRMESSIIRTEGTMAQKISLQDEMNAHIKFSRERDQLLEKIRNIRGFSNFLRPPQCSDLLSDLPKEGPVVIINCQKNRCDALALIAGTDDPLHIPLSSLYTQAQKLQRDMHHYLSVRGVRSRGCEYESDEESKVRAMRRAGFSIRNVLRDVLGELWLLVVKPVLDRLAISTEHPTVDHQRIWWCPTGPLAFLPIHAAGLYDDKFTKLGSCLTDFIISSYTPTVSTLVERVKKARALNETIYDGIPHGGLLLVSVPETPDFPRLARIPGTTRETESIQQRLRGSNFQTLSLGRDLATINNVMKGMESHSCVHFACHAGQDLDNPLKSGFYLHDGRLELSEVIKKQIAISDFAFLSACQTSTGHATLSEEVVHLAAGMLAAGYQGVVGTMWAIQDRYGPQIAKEFYGNLINHLGHDGRKGLSSDGGAHALHYAMQQIRKTVGDSEESLLIWVPYVHFGLLQHNQPS